MPSTRSTLSLVGLIAGLVWWAVDPFDGPAVGRGELTSLFVSTALGLVASFTWDGKSIGRWCALCLGLAAVVCGVSWHVGGQIPIGEVDFQGDTTRIYWWSLGTFVFLYVTVPFAQIFQTRGVARFPYADLFRHSWNNFFIGLVGALFVALVWAVLAIWGQLFSVIGVSFFEDLFETEPFAYLATFALFGFGLALGRENEAVIRTLRRVTLTVGHVMLPCVALIALLFTLTLPFTGLAPLWETGDATPLTLSLLALLTLFVNAVYEDGGEAPAYPGWLLVATRVSVLSMPVFAAIALRGTSIRVEQYGLTPERVFALIFATIASLYALGYAAAAAWPGGWMRLVRPINVSTALVMAGVALLVQLPILDPMRLSAESQVERLLEEHVEVSTFDFAILRFELGHRGWNALQRIEMADAHPAHEAILAKIKRVQAADNRWNAGEGALLEAAHLRVAPAGSEVPSGLLRTFQQHGQQCAGGVECLMLAVDLDRDQSPEYCVFVRRGGSAHCYANDGGNFVGIGELHFKGTGVPPTLRELMEPPTRTKRARYDDLVTESGDILTFVPRT